MVRHPFGNEEEGHYLWGERHGRWVPRHRDGWVEETFYVEGRLGARNEPARGDRPLAIAARGAVAGSPMPSWRCWRPASPSCGATARGRPA